jgi:hypothetical protein
MSRGLGLQEEKATQTVLEQAELICAEVVEMNTPA